MGLHRTICSIRSISCFIAWVIGYVLISSKKVIRDKYINKIWESKKSKKKANKPTVNDMPFVSVCTPTFNRRPFIKQMFRCFYHKTIQNLV